MQLSISSRRTRCAWLANAGRAVVPLFALTVTACGKKADEASPGAQEALTSQTKPPPPADATPSEGLLFAKSPQCYHCGKTHCSDLIKQCESIAGAAVDGPAKGKSRSDLCHSTLSCVLGRNCLSDRASIKCYCGAVEGPECATGKADGPCKTVIEAGLETANPTKVAVDYIKGETGGGVALGLVHCLLDNRCGDCI